jgi:hypothetical protein
MPHHHLQHNQACFLFFNFNACAKKHDPGSDFDRRGDLVLGVAATGGSAISFLPYPRFDIFADNLFGHAPRRPARRIFGRTAQVSYFFVAVIAFVAAAPVPLTQYRASQ